MLKKSGVLKTSKINLNNSTDNKQVGFKLEKKKSNDKKKEKLYINRNKTFNKNLLNSKYPVKEKKSFMRALSHREEIDEEEEKENNGDDENEILELDFSQNEQLNQYYNILKKNPYDNWCLSINKFEIFSFLMGHTNYHKNKFSDYCGICSTKCEIIPETIICENCFNFVLLFELVLNKMDDDCLDEFISGKDLYKAHDIKDKQKNNLRNFIYEEYGFLINKNSEKKKNENNTIDKNKFTISRHKTFFPTKTFSTKENKVKDEDDENVIIEDNNNVDEINTNKKNDKELNVHKKEISDDIINHNKGLNNFKIDDSEMDNSVINNQNSLQNYSRFNLVIKVIQRCFECRKVRENAYFKYDKEKNIYKCFNCTICEVHKFFNEGVFYKTITKNILTNLTFHKEQNLF